MLGSMARPGVVASRRRTIRSGAWTCPHTSIRSGQDAGWAAKAAASAAARSVREETPSGVAELHPAAAPDEQLLAQRLLQPRNPLGQDLLGEEQPGRGPAEMQLVGGDDEGPHLGQVQVHAHHLPRTTAGCQDGHEELLDGRRPAAVTWKPKTSHIRAHRRGGTGLERQRNG
jgi:hypothetical protein